MLAWRVVVRVGELGWGEEAWWEEVDEWWR